MRRRKWLALAALLSLLCAVTGCGKREETGYDIYYITTDRTGMTAEKYTPRSEDAESLIEELLDKLSEDTGSVDYMKTIPAKIKVKDYRLDQEKNLSLYFDRDYSSLEGYEEILIRSAIVRTLLQIQGIDSITFYVSNEPLQNAAGETIGSMNRESFIYDFGEETDSLLSTTLHLYFASADGASLVREDREVYYSSNIALEKLVMDNLLKGPDGENAVGIMPANTKLLNVSVTDGVCYVNLDATFLNQISGVSDQVIIYAIVNSLTELDNITKVQILINGSSNVIYHDGFDLNTLLEHGDISVLHSPGASGESEEKEFVIE